MCGREGIISNAPVAFTAAWPSAARCGSRVQDKPTWRPSGRLSQRVNSADTVRRLCVYARQRKRSAMLLKKLLVDCR